MHCPLVENQKTRWSIEDSREHSLYSRLDLTNKENMFLFVVKQLNPKLYNWRPALQWYFPHRWMLWRHYEHVVTMQKNDVHIRWHFKRFNHKQGTFLCMTRSQSQIPQSKHCLAMLALIAMGCRHSSVDSSTPSILPPGFECQAHHQICIGGASRLSVSVVIISFWNKAFQSR